MEFVESSEAKAAFIHLAYKKFKHVPLYLEFAPEGLLQSLPFQASSTLKKEIGDSLSISLKSDALMDEIIGENNDSFSQLSNIIFVKNLNFNTTDAELAQSVSHLTGFVKAKIATRKDIKKPGQILSCGFGHIEFKDHSSAKNALKQLQVIFLKL